MSDLERNTVSEVMANGRNTLSGRELDIAIARAMGHEVVYAVIDGDGGVRVRPLITNVGRLPRYSTDIANAFTLWRDEWTLERRPDGVWFIADYTTAVSVVHHHGSTPAEAIARAALAALEAEQ